MPPRAHERLVKAFKMLNHRETVHYHEPPDHVRMIHCGAERDERTAVVADHGEPLVPEVPHERDNVIGHRALRGLSVFPGIWRKRECP